MAPYSWRRPAGVRGRAAKAERTRSDPKTKNIPVVMLTGVGKRLGITFSTQDIYDFLGIEPDVYLEKPVDPIFLRKIINRLLGFGFTANSSEAGKEQGNGQRE